MNDELDKMKDQRPDFDAVKLIAQAYFGLHLQRFMSLPRAEMSRLMDIAGIDHGTVNEVLDSMMRLSCAYFADRMSHVLSLPIENLGNLMDVAQVDRTRVVGLLKAIKALGESEELMKRVLQ